MKRKDRILIFNDNNAISQMLKKSFEKFGFYAKVIDNGVEKEHWKTLKAYSPDLVALDSDMFEDGGIKFMQTVHSFSEYEKLPFIFMVHPNNYNILMEALKHGAYEYVYKPLDPDELNLRAKIILNISRDFENRLKNIRDEYLKATSATLHHEVNQPLSIILLAAELIETKGKTKLNKYDLINIQRIKSAVDKISDILYQLALTSDNEGGDEFITYDHSKMLNLPKSILRKKILVIDDNKDIRDIISEILLAEGADVLNVGSVKEALGKIEKYYTSLDAVFCDVYIGKGSGIEIFHKIRKLNEKINFVFITGYPIKGELRKIVKEFNVPVFKKPFTRRKVLLYLGVKKEKKKK